MKNLQILKRLPNTLIEQLEGDASLLIGLPKAGRYTGQAEFFPHLTGSPDKSVQLLDENPISRRPTARKT